MLHVRVVSPATLTGRVAGRLTAAPGVQNLIVQEGAVRRPDGDAVQFDVRDENANLALGTLRDLGVDRAGMICVERVDAALSSQPLLDGDHGALRRERAPVWEMVDAVIRAGQDYAPSFYILLAIAGLIGAVGLVTNSQVLIVAAMVVGPEYNAIIGVASGISRRDLGAVRDGLFALLWGFLAAIVVTMLFGLAVRGSAKTPAAFLAGVRPVADFISTPDVFSVIVAVLAGIVGVVSLTEARANALIGVFISVTTIPAAASVGVSIAYSSWGDAGGSALQLLLNVVLLIMVGAAGLSAQRRIWRRRTAHASARLAARGRASEPAMDCWSPYGPWSPFRSRPDGATQRLIAESTAQFTHLPVRSSLPNRQSHPLEVRRRWGAEGSITGERPERRRGLQWLVQSPRSFRYAILPRTRCSF